MKKKHFFKILIFLLVIIILVLLFNKELELIGYSILTGDRIDYYEPGIFSFIAVNEKSDVTTYHIFLKRKNKVIRSEYITYTVSNDQIVQMLDTISEYYDSYTIVSTQPHLRKWTEALTDKALEENLYYSVVIEDEQLGWINIDFSFFSDEIIIFDGYKNTKLR